MCTLSAILLRSGTLRVVMNRDERDDRPPALPPAWHDLNQPPARAIWPTDAKAGGTWFAATTHGLVFAIMNVSEQAAPPTQSPSSPANLAAIPDASYAPHTKLSRGSIIPSLVASQDLTAAITAAKSIRVADFPPFQLIIFAHKGNSLHTKVLRWNTIDTTFNEYTAASACFASSGLGDAKVQHRLTLFQKMLAANPTNHATAQDEFHHHQWPKSPHLSVLMRRPNHRTVSITTATLTPPAPIPAHNLSNSRPQLLIEMHYEPIP